MRIAIGCDHRGVPLRERIVDLLRRLGQEVVALDAPDCAAAQDVDYPDIAAIVARKVSLREVDRGILICGTGVGMCIVANKFPGVRAAPCHDELSAEVSRRHNDLNVLCLAGDVLAERPVERLLEVWLQTAFDGGRHARRLHKISQIEHNNGTGCARCGSGAAK